MERLNIAIDGPSGSGKSTTAKAIAKELDIIYEDDYVVVSRQNEKSNYVSVYDKVIIDGKDLN